MNLNPKMDLAPKNGPYSEKWTLFQKGTLIQKSILIPKMNLDPKFTLTFMSLEKCFHTLVYNLFSNNKEKTSRSLKPNVINGQSDINCRETREPPQSPFYIIDFYSIFIIYLLHESTDCAPTFFYASNSYFSYLSTFYLQKPPSGRRNTFKAVKSLFWLKRCRQLLSEWILIR